MNPDDPYTGLERRTQQRRKYTGQERRKSWRTLTPWRIAVLGTFLALIVYGIVDQNQGARIVDNRATAERADAAADAAQAAAERAEEAIRRIQASRLENCREGNRKHDNFIREYDRQVELLSPADRAEAVQFRDANLSILKQLAPKQVCREVIRAPDRWDNPGEGANPLRGLAP